MAGGSACPTFLHKHLRRLWGRRFRLPLIFSHSRQRVGQVLTKAPRNRTQQPTHCRSGFCKTLTEPRATASGLGWGSRTPSERSDADTSSLQEVFGFVKRYLSGGQRRRAPLAEKGASALKKPGAQSAPNCIHLILNASAFSRVTRDAIKSADGPFSDVPG
jgi:hypothetical protein